MTSYSRPYRRTPGSSALDIMKQSSNLIAAVFARVVRAVKERDPGVRRGERLGAAMLLSLALSACATPHLQGPLTPPLGFTGPRIEAGTLGRGAFVVQDAHRWPLALWEQLLHDVRVAAPDVVLVAEGDPSPAQAHALSLVGFHQTTPPLHRALGVHDVEEVLTGIGRGSVTRPQLLASTRHRRSSALTGGSAATFQAWAAVAALGGPAWGVSSTFSPTDDHADETVAAFLTRLNELRRSHPALRSRRGLVLRPVHHAGVLAFSRTCADDEVLVVIDLFPAFSKTVGVQTTLTGSDGRLQDELDGSWHAAESILLDLEHPVRVLTGRR